MFQTALDLSKQWPQALLRFGLGSTYVAMVITWVNGSDLTWMDAIYDRTATASSASLVFALASLCAVCYVIGSILAASGETAILGFKTDYRVKLAANVFDTGNGLLIQQYQEVRRNAQLFGGILQTMFLSGITIWLAAAISGDLPRLLDDVYGLAAVGDEKAETALQTASSGWWQVLLAAVLIVGLVVVIVRTVRQMTHESFIAIAVEVELRKALQKKDAMQ